MHQRNQLIDFILKEWLLTVAGVGVVLTSIYNKQLPSYSAQEMEVLFLLLALFVIVNGLKESKLIEKISQHLEKGKYIPLQLIVATFFLSMLVTNDVVLIVLVPLTLTLNVNCKDVLVILQALAANAGSALTPFGNPQNLFIYWFYNLSAWEFITSIAPFSFVFLFLLIVLSLFIKTKKNPNQSEEMITVRKSSYIYGILLFLVLLTILRILPLVTVYCILFYVLIFDRKALRVDFALLLSFFFFFGLAENIKFLLASKVQHSDHIFLFSALASQVISNVPAALLFTKFTIHWKALLWGTNVGGFGSLFGSLANLIAYRLYVNNGDTNNPGLFTTKFLLIGYSAFFIAIGLYFSLQKFLQS